MPSNYQSFWKHDRYAVVGHSAKANFPMLTYRGLKELGKTVFAVDPSVKQIDGDTAFADLCPLPEPVDAVILEVPKQETKGWVARAATSGCASTMRGTSVFSQRTKRRPTGVSSSEAMR